MIGSSSDLLVEVAKAADPLRAATARRRLDSLASSSAHRFENLLATPGSDPRPIPSTSRQSPGSNKIDLPMKAARRQSRDSDAYRSLGTLLLQKAFESIIPASSSTGASKSAAGVWKSMLAQQLADTASTSVFPSRAPVRESGAERISS